MPQPTVAYQYIDRTSAQPPCSLSLSVEEKDCLAVAQLITDRTGQPVCVLNMANSMYVGGDYLTSKGQEESLIQRTNLLESLIQLEGVKPGTVTNPYKYQLSNCLGFSEASRVGFGEFTCLYSAEVEVNQLNNSQPLGRQAFKVNVISSAAYNLANDDAFMAREFYIAGTVFKIINQLRTAKLHGQRHLVLGAFGCGAFQNNPQLIAELYHSILNEFEFQGSFDTICFAIKPTYNGQANSNYLQFAQEFACPPKILNDLLKEVLPLRNTNSTLHSMLIPFDTVGSTQELFFLATKLITIELTELAHFPQKNEYKINFYKHLRQLLQIKPNEAREILASALQSPVCQALTSTSGLFKGIKPSLITKLENLLTRTPFNISGFLPDQIKLVEESVEKFILPRAKELITCCENERDKLVSCYMLYITAAKSRNELTKELRNRYVGLIEVHNLLLAINELCLGQSEHSIYNTIADNRFFSGTEKRGVWKNQIAKGFGDYVRLRLLAFLEISYPIYFNQEGFEHIFEQNTKAMNNNNGINSPCIL